MGNQVVGFLLGGLDGLTDKLKKEGGKEEVKDPPKTVVSEQTTDPKPPSDPPQTDEQKADNLIAQIRATDLETLISTNDSLREIIKGFKKVKQRIAIGNALDEHTAILTEAENEK